jgi:MFS family permease
MNKSGFYRWVVVGLLWVVALLNYMDRQMLSTMRPFLEADIPALRSATSFGYLMAIFLWVYAGVSPLAGWLADRVSRKWLIVAGLLVWSSVTYSMGYTKTFGQLYALRAVMGVSEALYIPAALSLIADYHGDRSRSLAIGIHMTGLYAGQALGGFGATIAAALSWHACFQLFGCVGVGYAVVLAVFLKDRRVGSVLVRGERAGLFRQFPFWVLLFCFAAASLPGWAVKNWLPTLFSVNLNTGMAEAGPISTVSIALSSLLGVLVGGVLSDRWVLRDVRGRVYTGAIGLALTIPSLCLLGFAGSMGMSVVVALCFGVGYGMFDANVMPMLCQVVPEKVRATAYGLMNTVGVVAGAVITSVLGRSMDAGRLGVSFSLLSLFVLFAVVCMLIFLVKDRSRYELYKG